MDKFLIYNENNLNLKKHEIIYQVNLKPILVLPLVEYNFVKPKKCL
ncbi:hypothetical protein RC62_2714 [Flavobacterium aquidurense]|uniref:Uncharacterized protein n=1 Tax=Flavobacterium aquidurense TaxID=362413 RepID=A0A0N8VLV1_9FLAO|nr:hypothetical protein RC62_2714 [Flavobacterium aquidurense]